MKISILTVFSELYETFLKTSLMGRAQDKGLLSFDVASFFSYVAPKERIDAPTCGPGSGMLIKPDVVEKAIADKEQQHGAAYKVFFSPQGKRLNQRLLQQLAARASNKGHLMLVPARYEGMDARVEECYADEVVSVGDLVLMGGDIPAMMLLEGLLRLIPGVVGKTASVEEESFSGPFVDYPEYTEPVVWRGYEVPAIVRSGNHGAIAQWRTEQAAKKTVLHHFQWLKTSTLDQMHKELARRFIPAHYVALLHNDVLVGDGRIGTTSVTTLDIHDGARSCATYGIKNFFIVTALTDQKTIVTTMLDFWQTKEGRSYNRQRSEAVRRVALQDSLADVCLAIKEKEGVEPVVVATSARKKDGVHGLRWSDQEKVWREGRPVLFIFGTGKGLTDERIEQADFVLDPLEGFTDYVHLSVRSALGIALDRWLGIQPKA